MSKPSWEYSAKSEAFPSHVYIGPETSLDSDGFHFSTTGSTPPSLA